MLYEAKQGSKAYEYIKSIRENYPFYKSYR